MKIKLFLGFSSFLITSSLYAQNDNLCVSGNPQRPELIHQLLKAKNSSDVSKHLVDKYNLTPGMEAQAVCTTGHCAKPQYAEFRDFLQDKFTFKPECVSAIANIQTGSNELKCPENKKGKFSFCSTKETLFYQNAVLTDFYRCVSKISELPISPNILFKMYALESGFKPAYTNIGGTGAGQLTSIFIDDIHQKHRGRGLLSSISNSTDSECTAAKMIAEKDLKQKPSFSNKCNFTEYGGGFERNILYSLVGLNTKWNKDVKPHLKNYLEKHKSNPKLQEATEKLLLNGYGAGGIAAAKATIRATRSLKPEKMIEALDKPIRSSSGKMMNDYLVRMAKKQKDVQSLLKEPFKSEFKSKGVDACIESTYSQSL